MPWKLSNTTRELSPIFSLKDILKLPWICSRSSKPTESQIGWVINWVGIYSNFIGQWIIGALEPDDAMIEKERFFVFSKNSVSQTFSEINADQNEGKLKFKHYYMPFWKTAIDFAFYYISRALGIFWTNRKGNILCWRATKVRILADFIILILKR